MWVDGIYMPVCDAGVRQQGQDVPAGGDDDHCRRREAPAGGGESIEREHRMPGTGLARPAPARDEPAALGDRRRHRRVPRGIGQGVPGDPAPALPGPQGAQYPQPHDQSAEGAASRVLREIWAAPSADHAMAAAKRFVRIFGDRYPKATKYLIDDLPAFFDYPADHWQLL